MTIGKSRRCEAFSGQQSQGRCYDKSCLILTALFMVGEPGDWEKCVYQPIATLCARLSAINAAYTLDKSNTAWNLNKLQKMKQSLNQLTRSMTTFLRIAQESTDWVDMHRCQASPAIQRGFAYEARPQCTTRLTTCTIGRRKSRTMHSTWIGLVRRRTPH